MNPAARSPEDAPCGFLFTRYPILSEQFLHREVLTLQEQGLSLDILPLWPAPEPFADALPVTDPFSPVELLTLFFWIPYWSLLRPKAMSRLTAALSRQAPGSWINTWENLLGMGYGLIRARRLRRRYAQLHAVWASAPATAAWTVHLLTEMPFSMAGHAYDLYEDGGDWLIEEKVAAARFIRTSTEAGHRRWIQLGAAPHKVHLIRRGLPQPPPLRPSLRPRLPRRPARLLAVGRMVEKMGYAYLLEVAAACRNANLSFSLMIIGDGPEREQLEKRCADYRLHDHVRFVGAQPFAEVAAAYRQSDLFLFTGTISRRGDRAGFPNVIGEAMAAGLPVAACPVGAVTEAIQDGQTGILLSGHPHTDAARISALLEDPDHYKAIRERAYDWICAHFLSSRNMQEMAGLLRSCDDR